MPTPPPPAKPDIISGADTQDEDFSLEDILAEFRD
jgi:hypothetical protein